MNIIYGNLLDAPKGLLVHGVNSRGVMGSGIALDVKRRFPTAFQDYQKKCYTTPNLHALLGEIVVSRIREDLFIINAFTQRNYGVYHQWTDENNQAIKNCFHKVNILAKHYKLPVCFPMIGTGLGKGDWSQIKEIILNTLDKEIDKTLYILQENPRMSNCVNCD